MEYQLELYESPNGKVPFDVWYESLKDSMIQALIINKLDKIKKGNLGDSKSVGGGISEFKIHSGPGYRLYFAKVGNRIILLLCGGTKNTQQKDITRAQKYWGEFKMRQGVCNAKN